MNAVDWRTVAGFGDEWSAYDQTQRSGADLKKAFDRYFAIFPWEELPDDAVGMDVGTGSGRWAALAAPRVGRLYCVDPSRKALEVAARNLDPHPNCVLVHAAAGKLPFADASMDFGYSLGVLHHTPDPLGGLRDCVRKLRPGAPFLLYLYYAFDNRPVWYRLVWRLTDVVRVAVAKLPFPVRKAVATAIAALVYLPFARAAAALESRGRGVRNLPLAAYRTKPFYVMRTDALDRFGTRTEGRFTWEEIRAMMLDAGLTRITFAPSQPFWCAVGYQG